MQTAQTIMLTNFIISALAPVSKERLYISAEEQGVGHVAKYIPTCMPSGAIKFSSFSAATHFIKKYNRCRKTPIDGPIIHELSIETRYELESSVTWCDVVRDSGLER